MNTSEDRLIMMEKYKKKDGYVQIDAINSAS